MNEATRLPPLGPVPRYIATHRRRDELARAIYEYLSEGRVLAPEWVEEYNETVAWLNAHEKSLASRK